MRDFDDHAPDPGPADLDDPTAQPLPHYRHRHYQVEDRSELDVLFDAEGYAVIAFAPVPRRRRRRHGWDAERQRAFIALLARVPSVGHAARAVGLSARSAYKLLECPGAEAFARAWDMAIEHGMTRLRGGTLSRCLEGGDFVPIYRKGRLARIEWRANDRLAMSLLSGKAMGIECYRRRAQGRWAGAQEWRALDAERAATIAAEALAREAAAAAIEAAAARVPRVRSL